MQKKNADLLLNDVEFSKEREKKEAGKARKQKITTKGREKLWQ